MSGRSKDLIINVALVAVAVFTVWGAWKVVQGLDGLVERPQMHHFNHGPQDAEPTH